MKLSELNVCLTVISQTSIMAFSLCIFSSSLIVGGSTYRCFIHLELIFVYGTRLGSSFTLPRVNVQLSAQFVEEILAVVILVLLLEIDYKYFSF